MYLRHWVNSLGVAGFEAPGIVMFSGFVPIGKG